MPNAECVIIKPLIYVILQPNESIDSGGAFYTIDRLRDQVRKLGANPGICGPAIIEDVRKFLGKAPQNDDMCLVCFGRVKG